MPLTMHAGEWPDNTADNIRVALELRARRVAHALTLLQDPELTGHLVEQGCAPAPPVGTRARLLHGLRGAGPGRASLRSAKGQCTRRPSESLAGT